MEKKEKIKIFVIVLLLLTGAYLLLRLVIFQTSKRIVYEFYDINGNYGTSKDCGNTEDGKLYCLVNNYYVPVSQFSK